MKNPNFTLLNTEPSRFSDDSIARLRRITNVFEHECDRNFLIDNIHKFNAIFIGLKNVIDKEILDNSSKLECIITPTTGLNHIDIHEANRKNIVILSLKDELDFLKTLTSTAELTWALLLNLIRNIYQAHKSVVNKKWDRDRFKGKELKELTLGIIGYGRLGSMVASYGSAFGMNIIVNDISLNSNCPYDYVNLDELLTTSDVITIHVPMNDDTKLLLNKKNLYKLKHGAILINTSRGEIIDEDIILDLLKSGTLAGFGADVLSNEFSGDSNWLEKSKLRIYAMNNNNILISPHIGGVTEQSVEKANNFMIGKLSKYLNS